ncbi:MAG: ABC transporter ATP-binding protein [Pirellulales bacterium]
MPIIETVALSRSYGNRRGIDRISLSIPSGTLYGFLGPNGAGKSTAMRVLLGLLKPNGGAARIFGLDCWRQSAAIKAEVGYVPGDLRLYSWLTGRSALRLFARVRKRDMWTHGSELADAMELPLDVKVRNMSRGMRQKLGLILALAHRPQLLILDEPTASLDPIMQKRLHAVLKSLVALGHTVFFSSHTLSEVEQICDRVAIIREGRIVADEALDVLRAEAGHVVTIRWRNGQRQAALQPPPFLELETHGAEDWKGILHGPVDDLIAWLANHSVADLSIGRPDLETLFRRYYEADESPR